MNDYTWLSKQMQNISADNAKKATTIATQAAQIETLKAALEEMIIRAEPTIPYLPNPGYGWIVTHLVDAMVKARTALAEVTK